MPILIKLIKGVMNAAVLQEFTCLKNYEQNSNEREHNTNSNA